jgi:hypothetical protein
MIMLPIGMAIIAQLDAEFQSAKLARWLGTHVQVAYSAHRRIGTLIGTPPNIILAAWPRSSAAVASATAWLHRCRWSSLLPLTWFYRDLLVPSEAQSVSGSSVVTEELANRQDHNPGVALWPLSALTAGLDSSEPKKLGHYHPGTESCSGISDNSIAATGALALFVIPARARGNRLLIGPAPDILGHSAAVRRRLALAEDFASPGSPSGRDWGPAPGAAFGSGARWLWSSSGGDANTATAAMILPVCASGNCRRHVTLLMRFPRPWRHPAMLPVERR